MLARQKTPLHYSVENLENLWQASHDFSSIKLMANKKQQSEYTDWK